MLARFCGDVATTSTLPWATLGTRAGLESFSGSGWRVPVGAQWVEGTSPPATPLASTAGERSGGAADDAIREGKARRKGSHGRDHRWWVQARKRRGV